MEQKTNNKQIPWVTLAKFLGLYLMVLGHMNLVCPEWGAFIFTFHMPLFFVLSGMLHKDTDNKKQLFKNLFRKLIVPFLLIAMIWCLIYMVLWIKNGIVNPSHWLSYILGTIISPGKPLCQLHSLKEPLWFLLALTWIKVMASYLRKPWIMIVVSVVCPIVILVFSHFRIVLPLAIDSALFAFPFYTAGLFIKKYLLKDFSVIINIVVALLFLVFTFFIYRNNGIVDTNHCLYGNNIVLYYLGGFVGTIFLIHLSKVIASFVPIGMVFSTIVSGAMLVIGFSNNLSSIIRSFLPFLGGSNVGGMVIGLLTLAVIFPMILIAKKYFPAIIGFRK